MLNHLLFFMFFDIGFFVIPIVAFIIITCIIVFTTIKFARHGKNISKLQNDTFTAISNHISDSLSSNTPENTACEYCGFTNSSDSKKCSCCGAPIKTKKAK